MWYLCKPGRTLSALVLLGWFFSATVEAAFWQDSITREQWDAHGQGRDLVRLDAVRELLSRFDEKPGTTLTIHHPGGDAGFAWGAALRDWLVALGIPSVYMTTAPGSGGLDLLHISLTTPDS